jgi:6-phosphogluconolactonase
MSWNTVTALRITCLFFLASSWSIAQEANANIAAQVPRYVFEAILGAGGVQIYSVNPASGTLRPFGSLPNVAVPNVDGAFVTVHPNGRFVYVPNGGIVQALALRPNGTAATIKGSPFLAPGATRLGGIAVPPSGKFLIVIDATNPVGEVWSFLVNPTTGALTVAPGSPVASGYSCSKLAIDPASKFVYIASCSGNPGVWAYSINPTTGALSAVPGSPFPSSKHNSQPQGITIDASGKYAYVEGHSGIDGYKINSTTGALKLISGSPFGSVLPGSAIATDPLGKFIYGSSASCLCVYTVNSTTGALTQVPGTPLPDSLENAIATDPNGNFLYTAGGSVIQVNRATGALTVLAPGFLGGGQGNIALSSGPTPIQYFPKFAYVANSGDDTVTGYSIDPTSGNLTKLGTTRVGKGPRFLTTDVAGKYLYAANSTSNSVSAFKIGAKGTLSQLAGSPYATDNLPVWITVDPLTRVVYVANSSSATVTAFGINPSSGILTSLHSTPFAGVCGGFNLDSLVVELGDTYLYADCGTLASSYNMIAAVIGSNGSLAIAGGAGGVVYEAGSLTLDVTGYSAYAVGRNAINRYDFNQFNIGFLGNGPQDNDTGGLALDPFSRFAYAMESSNNTVQADNTNLSTGLTLIAGSPFSAGTNPVAGAVDYSGKFLYVVNQGSNDVSAYSIDQTTGSLTPLTTPTFAAGMQPVSIVTTGTMQ